MFSVFPSFAYKKDMLLLPQPQLLLFFLFYSFSDFLNDGVYDEPSDCRRYGHLKNVFDWVK